jgi:D-3-phosphoglycerate dehydrogenase
MDQVVVTPHLGAATTEAQEKVAAQIAEQMSDYLLNGAVTNAINMPSVSSDEAPRLKPYMSIVRQLGSLLGQLADEAIVSVAIEYEGTVATLNTKPLTALALEGLLSRQLENVNMINAPMIAEERNIDVSEVTRSAPGDYQTMVRLRVGLEGKELSIAGTLYSDQHPRVVELNGIAIEAKLGPNMLYVTNEDKPGFIGRLGTTLGDAGVNIATFNLGRSTRGGEALALIELDEPIPADILGAVRELPYVGEAVPLAR